MKKHTFLVSDESVNSHGFKILTEGIDTTRFEQNPIMLYMHESPVVIGRWENLVKKDGKMFADAIFDEDDTIAKEVLGKVERGFIKATSLGISYKKEDLIQDSEGDVLQKCELYEISIVAVPSNGNALKLYNDSFDTVQLKLNKLSNVNSIAQLLEVKADKNQEKEVLTAVKNLKLENTTLKQKFSVVETKQEQELNEIIDLAVKRNLLNPVLKSRFVELGKTDFYGTKEELVKLFPIQGQSFFEQIETSKLRNNKEGNKFEKAKSEWNLDDYRKNAPQELESNPELFKKLLAEYNE